MKEFRKYYQYGSAALSADRILEDPDYRYREEQRKRRERNEEIARRRAHRQNMRVSKLSAISTCLGVILVSAGLFGFVFLQNQVSASKKHISNLENEITKISTLNDAAKSRIDSSIDLTKVREKAEGRMGMVYADSDHVVYYQMSGLDYMNTYN